MSIELTRVDFRLIRWTGNHKMVDSMPVSME